MAHRPVRDLEDRELEDVLARLRAATEEDYAALAHFLLAELLWRNCFLAVEAFAHYEEAVKLAPSAPLFAEILGDRAGYVGFKELAAASYARMGDQVLLKLAAAHERSGDTKRAVQALKRALERDPFDVAALRRLATLLRIDGRSGEANELEQAFADLVSDSGLRAAPLVVEFEPARPAFDTTEPAVVGETVVYDHSEFALRLTNPSQQPVEVQQVRVLTQGTASASGLGNIKQQMVFPRQSYILHPGESAVGDRTWGFVVDTEHQQLSYVVDYCWNAVDEKVRRCRYARVDTLPR